MWPSVAKHKLDMAPDPEVMLIGISCHENDYRLCWALNRELGIDLVRRASDITEPGPEKMASYSAFDHTDQEHEARWTLVHNRSADGILLKDHTLSDYCHFVYDSAPMPAHILIQR